MPFVSKRAKLQISQEDMDFLVQTSRSRTESLSKVHTVAKTLNANYQDTWHGALGLHYRASDKWVFSAGAAFDSSAVENANRTVTLPMGQTWRFGLGAAYQLSSTINVGLSETFMWADDMPVDQGDALSLRGRVSGA